ncbi:MAG: hypothetical protein MZV63_19610 [Marinilabiliales bacterium]|nr:hypothetical protein [Marinilabiliales bacterium]
MQRAGGLRLDVDEKFMAAGTRRGGVGVGRRRPRRRQHGPAVAQGDRRLGPGAPAAGLPLSRQQRGARARDRGFFTRQPLRRQRIAGQPARALSVGGRPHRRQQ